MQNFAVADFQTIKDSLITYLQGQSQFSGYNFAGSNLNIIIDMLAYNTYSNLLYKNIALNEQFLQTAQLRNTIIQRCNELGYLPISAKSAVAYVNIHVTNTVTGNPSTLTIPPLTPFNTTVDGTPFTFYTLVSTTTNVNSDGTYDFTDIPIYEGVPLTKQYVNDGTTKFIIPNAGCDVSSIAVSVQNSAVDSTTSIFTSFNDLSTIDNTTPVFFVRESSDQTYEVYFGQNGFGVGLAPNNIIHIFYMVSSAAAANGAASFTMQGTLNGGQVSIITSSPASGGSDVESIDSIRFNAPLQFMAQNRAVTAPDYSVLIKNVYPAATSISVWGGEDNIPPKYGNVFACIVPKLTSNEKKYIISSVANKSMLTNTLNIVDPDVINLIIETSVHYNTLKTSKTPSTLQTLIENTINNYATTYLGNFSSIFRYTQFTTMVDNTDPAILNNNTIVSLRRVINPSVVYYDSYANYGFTLGNPILYTGQPEESIVSSGFYITGDTNNVYYIDDDGVGNLRLFYYDSANVKVIKNTKIGTVQYSGTTQSADGIVSISNLSISQLVNNEFYFNIKLQSYDVTAFQNQIIQILPNDVSVTMLPETVAPTATVNLDYVFGSNR